MVIFLLGAAITTGDFGLPDVAGIADALGSTGAGEAAPTVELAEGLAEALGDADGLGVAALLSGSWVNFTRTRGAE